MMFFPYSFQILTILSLFGCSSDPILEKAAELQQENPSSSKKSEIQNSQPKPGIPTEPKPVQVQPKVVSPPQSKEEKAKSAISGIVEIKGEGDWASKAIRIDIFDGDQQILGEPRPKVIATKRISQVGEFSIMVDKDTGNLWLGAYCDLDGDGRPGPKDPSGWYAQNPVSSKEDLEGIVISLEIPKEEHSQKEEKK